MASYLLIWVIAFVAVGILDAFWHLVLFKRVYTSDMQRLLPRQPDGKQTMRGTPAIIGQILVITAYVGLVALVVGYGGGIWASILVGVIAGVLSISVYGLVNRGLVHEWSVRLTVLETIWGPIIGACSGALVFWLITLFRS